MTDSRSHRRPGRGTPGRSLAPPEIADRLQRAFAHHQRSELASAEALYREVLAAVPVHAQALHLLGLVKYQQGENEVAIDLIRKSTAAEPGQAAAHSNLALALHALKRYAEALASCDRALALDPRSPAARNNRGNALHELRRYHEALADYDAVLALAPAHAEAHYNRARTLHELHRNADAVASYDRARALGLASTEFFHNLGTALQQGADYEGALACYERALALDAGFDAARYNLSLALYSLRRYEEAANSFARLLDRAPDCDYALGYLLSCQMYCCDWASARQSAARVARAIETGGKAAVPFIFLTNSPSAAAQLQCARTYVADAFLPLPAPLWSGERYVHERIRLAYLSADFHDHATSWLAARLIEQHDRQRFHLIGVSFGPDDDGPMRQRLRRAFAEFLEVRERSDAEIAQALREREVDIAVDLKGYTAGGRPRILAHRPAPVQVSYLGYPSTMGADFVDYLIADAQVVPPGHDGFYAEKVVRLPDAYQVNDDQRPIAERTPSRTEAGLPDAGFVFCCFNASYKITAAVFDAWMRLLGNVEASVLWLLDANPAAVRNLRQAAHARGVAPERLVFAPRLPVADHLARHRLADLMLDTSPVNAHTAASDALWAGLPLVTCADGAFAGRVAGSLLGAAGLPELVTGNLVEYEALALRLARDSALLAGLRARLQRNRATCPLFATDRFCRHLESAYLTMWSRAGRGEPPVGFSVPPSP